MAKLRLIPGKGPVRPAAKRRAARKAVVPSIAAGWKRCKGCGEVWPADAEFFHRNAGGRDGLRARCRACVAEWPSQKARRPGGGAGFSAEAVSP